MKRNWKRQYFLAAVGVIAIGAKELISEGPRAKADEPVEWCGTYEYWVASVGNDRAVATGACPTEGTCDTPSVRDSWIPEPSTPIVTLRMKFHIFCETDGSNCASSPSEVAGQMSQLNSDYGPYRIQFTEGDEAEYINDSTYRQLSTSEFAAMKNTYADDPGHQINVYVTDIPSLGIATFPFGPGALGNEGGILMDETAFGTGDKVLTHEVGHCLGLWHTHHGVSEVGECSACYERADGVDGDITGDFASQTPPTPRNSSCSDPSGNDPCSVPPTPWAPTQTENFMGYAPQSCWTLFTPQQAGRAHCWIHDVLTGWIVVACTTNEVSGSTCQDGVDNDCDGWTDCDDVFDCESEAACHGYCDDNLGSSPLVCVFWAGTTDPVRNFNFFLGSGSTPDVTFVTGNDGWKVWSQVSLSDNTPANLGHIRIDPSLPTENFSVTVAHGPSAGAANVASITLVDEGWTGVSNLSGGSIAGDLEADLIVQESATQGGIASFTIGGDLYGDITIPKVDTLEVTGSVSLDSTITLHEFVGQMRAEFNTGAYEGTPTFEGGLSLPNGLPSGSVVSIHGYFRGTTSVEINGNGQELAGFLSFHGGSAGGSEVNVGPLTTGQVYLLGAAYSGAATLYSGTATFTSVESGASITIAGATLDGSITVDGDWAGSLYVFDGSAFGAGGLISIGGSVTATGSLFFQPVPGTMGGALLIGQNCDGSVTVDDDISGPLTVTGVYGGDLCADNVSPYSPLPNNIFVNQFGPGATICGTQMGASQI